MFIKLWKQSNLQTLVPWVLRDQAIVWVPTAEQEGAPPSGHPRFFPHVTLSYTGKWIYVRFSFFSFCCLSFSGLFPLRIYWNFREVSPCNCPLLHGCTCQLPGDRCLQGLLNAYSVLMKMYWDNFKT